MSRAAPLVTTFLYIVIYLLGSLLCIQVECFTPASSRPRNYPLHRRTTTTELYEASSNHYVVVGGGWGGWGAAKALCEAGSRVTLLDALPDPRQPYLYNGKPVEPGTRGFWKDYPNINQLCQELDLKNVFTDFTNSSFYSPDGLEATAPVFSKGFPDNNLPLLSALSGQSLDSVPSPVGQVLATFPYFERLPLQDRATMVGLLIATIDCLAGDDKVQAAYDRMTAHELFRVFGLSERLVRDFIQPTLLVGLFKPPTELSALVVMELLYYYALAHVDSFDVQWIRNGTVSSSLIAPLASHLLDNYDLQLLSQSPVTQITVRNDMVTGIEYKSGGGTKSSSETTNITDIAGVVLAVSANGMNKIVGNSPTLAEYPLFSKAASSASIDVISVRLWLDRTVPTRTPANVFANFDSLRGAGGTFFMLDQLQDPETVWGNEIPQGSVVACDFYNAGALLSLSNSQIVDILMKDLLPSAVPKFADAQVVDAWVGKFPRSVTWFSPGSFDRRPSLETPVQNLKCAGDWVKMGKYEHGAKGLCQERAYVSGLQAANLLLAQDKNNTRKKKMHGILPVRQDQAQFRAAMELNRNLMRFLPRPWIR